MAQPTIQPTAVREHHLIVRGMLGPDPEGLGTSATAFLGSLAVEGGVGRTNREQGTAFVRLGPSIPLFEPKRGVLPNYQLVIQPMFGGRYEEFSERQRIAADTVMAFDSLFWLTDRIALDAQIAIGATFRVWQSDATEARMAPLVRFGAGFAF